MSVTQAPGGVQIKAKVKFHGYTVIVEGTYWQGERRSRDCPGVREEIEITSVRAGSNCPNLIKICEPKSLRELERKLLDLSAYEREEAHCDG